MRKMTDDDIEDLAYQAGNFFLIKFGAASASMDWLRNFAQKVAAAERESCAQVAEKMLRYYTQGVTGVPEAIRARGEKNEP